MGLVIKVVLQKLKITMKDKFDFITHYSNVWLDQELKNHKVKNTTELWNKTLTKKLNINERDIRKTN
jgi:hypothetical protein